jgi:type II secretory pathway pseudopilin PulG
VTLAVRTRQANGFALIDLIFVCGIIGLLASISMPNLMQARQSAGSASAIGSMRAINSAQLTFAITCGSGFYAPRLTVLGTPPPASNASFIAKGLGESDTIIKSTYAIQLSATPFAGAPASCNGLAAGAGGQGFKAAADGTSAVSTRFFATSANSVIYEHTSTLWAAMPELGAPVVGHTLR